MLIKKYGILLLPVILFGACSPPTEPVSELLLKRGGTGSGAKVVSIAVEPVTVELVIGQSVQLTATALTVNGGIVPVTVQWASSDPTRVAISSDGLVTGLSTTVNGPVLLMASTGEGKKAVVGTASGHVNGVGRVIFEENFTTWMVAWDGSQWQRQLVYGGSSMHLDLSHDGQWFLHSIPFVNELWKRRVDGTEAVRLTSGAVDYVPTWSPDDSKILWARAPYLGAGNPGLDLWVMNADGSSPNNLTNNYPVEDGTAAWSPDGQRIVFLSYRDGDPELYIMNADGSGVTRITNTPGEDSWPSWSPDGSKIAWNSRRNGGDFDVFLAELDGNSVSSVVALTDNDTDDVVPRFSPDGRWLIYASNETGIDRLYTLRLDGTNAKASFPTGTPSGTGAWRAVWR